MLPGTGIKLLEAKANGLPCVAPRLALLGLDGRPGRLLMGTEPFAATLVEYRETIVTRAPPSAPTVRG